MKNEDVAQVAREMAALVRAFRSGQSVEAMEVWEAFSRMLDREATSPTDALALIVTVRTLLFGCPPVGITNPEESVDAFAMHHAFDLLNRAIAALENATGEKDFTYTGFGPSLN